MPQTHDAWPLICQMYSFVYIRKKIETLQLHGMARNIQFCPQGILFIQIYVIIFIYPDICHNIV